MSIQNNKSILVKEIQLSTEDFPVIGEKNILKEALEAMNKYRLGIACIVNDQSELLGVVTDGDIRRKILKVQKPFAALLVDDALEHSVRAPLTIATDSTLESAVKLMGEKQIWDLPVLDGQNRLCGLLHLHPAVNTLLAVAK